ncbi:MAG TPA: c-type cytochrome [Steroidobacteraceae bacterium]|nr:c-type cytochrome [Steroidobacteraceae bacterium]
MKRLVLIFACSAVSVAAWTQGAQKPADEPAGSLKIPYPEWLFPIDEDALKAARAAARAGGKPAAKQQAKQEAAKEEPASEDTELLTIPDSEQKFTAARIADPFDPPDWFPADHGPMPDVVAKGRKPKVIACAYCHTPTGAGRPENSALAGLPEAYIKEQLEAFRSGERPPVGPEDYLPARGMHDVAAAMTDEEIEASAKYFSQLRLSRRHYVAEAINIPRAEPAAWVYKQVGGSEDLGDRLLEVAADITRHERRDPRMPYTVYVPPGSLARGKLLATTGDKGRTQICATCHLAKLEGTDTIPPIAGRSPTYLLRQLLAFKNGARRNEAARQMDPVVEKLELEDMVALAAWIGSLYPPK